MYFIYYNNLYCLYTRSNILYWLQSVYCMNSMYCMNRVYCKKNILYFILKVCVVKKVLYDYCTCCKKIILYCMNSVYCM